MDIELAYGDKELKLSIPDKNLLGISRPVRIPHGEEETRILESVAKEIRNVIESFDKVLFVVNDGERPTPTAKILNTLESIISTNANRLKFIVATGAHKPPDTSTLKRIFGNIYDEGIDIDIHSAKDSEFMDLGMTSRNTPVKLNKILEWPDAVVCINSVEPHYFAGFTGGRKSILPGLAAFDTIELNHSWALDPAAENVTLEGNPVHEDMMEAVNLYINNSNKPVYGVQLILEGQNILDCEFGPLHEAFTRAVEISRKVSCTPVHDYADLVITCARDPMDATLYQSQKALENIRSALRPGSTVILVSPCNQGIGNRKFFDLLARHKNPDDVIEEIKIGYKLGYHKAAKIVEMTKLYSLYAYTDIKATTISKAHITPLSDIQSFIDGFISARREAKILVVPDAVNTIPLPPERGD